MKIILASTLIFFFFSSLAQNVDYDISKYKLPSMKRQSLDFLLNSSGSYIKASEDFDSISFNNIRGSSVSYSNLNYQLYINSPRKQLRAYSGFNGRFDKTYNRQVTSGTSFIQKKEDQLRSWFILHAENKQFNEKNWYWVAEPEYSMSWDRFRDQKENLKSHSFDMRASLGLGGGKGRIEQVQDFRQAILMINEFLDKGVLARPVTEQEMLEVAMLLSQLKNTRFFDARLRKEKDLVAIDSILIEKGLITEKGISYYYAMDDIWTYGALQVRESGNQVRFVFTPAFSRYHHESGPISSRSETRSLLNELVFESEKPLSLKWQRGYQGGIISRYRKVHEMEEYSSTLSLSAHLGYYPNTRTWLTWRVSSYAGISNFTGADDYQHSSTGIDSSLGYNYYISERIRLNMNSTLSYYNQDFKTPARADMSGLSLSTTINFTYSLF
jgi:hypothetical protein